ncbi:MAG: hypothetical protein V4621_03975 [Pseudomonadota bacterium]
MRIVVLNVQPNSTAGQFAAATKLCFPDADISIQSPRGFTDELDRRIDPPSKLQRLLTGDHRKPADLVVFPAISGDRSLLPEFMRLKDTGPLIDGFSQAGGHVAGFCAGAFGLLTSWYNRNNNLIKVAQSGNVAPGISAYGPKKTTNLQHQKTAYGDRYIPMAPIQFEGMTDPVNVCTHLAPMFVVHQDQGVHVLGRYADDKRQRVAALLIDEGTEKGRVCLSGPVTYAHYDTLHIHRHLLEKVLGTHPKPALSVA